MEEMEEMEEISKNASIFLSIRYNETIVKKGITLDYEHF